MITNEKQWKLFKKECLDIKSNRKIYGRWLSRYVDCWYDILIKKKTKTTASNVMESLLGREKRKIREWTYSIDVKQELWLILLEVIHNNSIPNTNWKKSWQIFEYLFVLKLSNKIDRSYKKRLAEVEYEDIFYEEDIFISTAHLSNWDKYYLTLRMGNSITDIEKLTNLSYKQLYYSEKKICTLIHEMIC